jgi:hypothetical protein
MLGGGAKRDGSRRPSGSARSPAVMPGRNAAGISVARSLSCSPPPLLGCVGLTLQSASADCHTRSLCLATAFRSPPRLRPFGRLHEGSMFPACRFGSLPNPASGPFGSPLLASLCFCIACAGPIHAAFPLPDADLDFPDRSSAFAPLWDSSLRFNASADANQRGSPSPSTRFPFAPRCWAPFYHCPLRIIVPGSPSLARLAVPSDLLEPST